MMEAPLSREILFGTDTSVKKMIQQGANVNAKDEWGFVPLIQATIANKVSIAEYLLEKGARVDEKDITGQTALQWAVNRRNAVLCDLFLKHKANPNHYSADGQPILVNPILRGEYELIRQLVTAGASTAFAEDFISAKLIGHRYELVGKADIINTKGQFIELDYEGFYLEFTVGLVLRTLINFVHSARGKDFISFNTVLQKIIEALKDASILVQYKYTMEGPKEHDKIISELLNKELLVIPVSYQGHAITFQKYGNMLSKCDRGVKHIVDTVITYQVGNPIALTTQFLKDLMYQPKTTAYINTDMKKILHLKPFSTLPARYQQSGNCSWANVEASIPALMFMLMFRGELENRGEIAALKQSIMSFYDTWIEWDKDRVLDELIQEFESAPSQAHKTAKASIMGAILLQRCRANVRKEVERARKILEILTLPEFNFILKEYIKVYCTRSAGSMGEQFTEILKACKLNFTTLTIPKPPG